MREPTIGLLHPGELGAAAGACLFAGTALSARVIGDQPGTASALKMAYAAWTKGTAALILAVRALARAEGVEQDLLAEWAQSQPNLDGLSQGAARSAAAKGWRWVAEMEEIAASMAADGLPGGFHEAAATIFAHMAPGPLDESAADTVIDSVLTQRGQAADGRTARL